MNLNQQIKSALNDNRLLILGSQVLFGFQFNAVFAELFDNLTLQARTLIAVGLLLLIVTIGLLIVPSMQHRIVERGRDSGRVLKLATQCSGWALAPLACALAFDFFVVLQRFAGATIAIIMAAAFFAMASFCWFVLELLLRMGRKIMVKSEAAKATPLDAQVEQLLTEARVIIPGAQALLGFQFAVTLTHAFDQLPQGARAAHVAALCCVGVAIILLMAPASLHRIAFVGQDDPEFVRIGSWLVMAAPLPLAFGISLDAYVATLRAIQSELLAALLAAASAIALLGCWYLYPIAIRWRRSSSP